ncbi:MAG: AAA domain-containing protein [Caldilineaceae bacterium SB0662_bin_9]|uniref:AAA domain-containing protein n=1 Tax=Caldilineaceae bacterium SB0662_bin_9 TaxID=2605258 RepID=A0A6B1DS63_9CHLR|nr:AAA domain-containing protein [Caldilineaceae bacterium SB0662_bin_9]
MTNVYTMKLGASGMWEDQAISNKVLRIGFGISNKVSDLSTPNSIRKHLGDSYQRSHLDSDINQVHLFLNIMKKGDLILVNLKTRPTVAVGTISGDCWTANPNEILRPVTWHRHIKINDIYQDLIESFPPRGKTIHKVEVTDAAFRVKRIVETGKDPGPTSFWVEDSRYSPADIIRDGCFATKEHIFNIIERLRTKKNLILQGPPGTGKTWLAKRLAWALVGRKDTRRVRAVQFHPNLSYEDFVRGWRPSSNGKLELVNGPFLEIVEAANQDAASSYVLVIEEINRGDPAQILGEMLTLLEADKRNQANSLELTYKHPEDEPGGVYLPPNLHVIGTMNIADRSLALVDLALRRRFAFVDLMPEIGDAWKVWVREQVGFDNSILSDIQDRMLDLNNTIEADPKLGRQFQVGHSYVTPLPGAEIEPASWYRDVVESEIGPLLEEYWFDEPTKAREERDKLLKGLGWL